MINRIQNQPGMDSSQRRRGAVERPTGGHSQAAAAIAAAIVASAAAAAAAAAVAAVRVRVSVYNCAL